MNRTSQGVDTDAGPERPLSRRRKAMMGLCLLLVTGGVLVLLAEGLYALSRVNRPDVSLSYRALKCLGVVGRAAPAPLVAPLDAYVQDMGEVAALLPELKSSGVTLGNTPFTELATGPARITYNDPDGELLNRASSRVTSMHLRSRVLNSFDPIVFNQVGTEKQLPEHVRAFLGEHGFIPTYASTDARGDRVTLPASASSNIVLVVGDSVAFGVLLNDDETLASQLQRLRPGLRFINASVPGADSKANLHRLGERLREFGPRVRGVIYVFCENDITPEFDTPARLGAALAEACQDSNLLARVYVHTQYIYRSLPDVIRSTSMPKYASEVTTERISELMRWRREMGRDLDRAGFDVVDWYHLVQGFRAREGSLLAGLALYVDHCHLSRRGTALLAERISRPGGALDRLAEQVGAGSAPVGKKP